MLVAFPVCGSCGRPSEAVSTTVPVIGGTLASVLMLARSCAGVLLGRSGDACAAGICRAATVIAVTATAAPGTAQRARLDNFTRMLLTRSRALRRTLSILTLVLDRCDQDERPEDELRARCGRFPR